MDRACKQQGSFKKNRNYKETATNNQKERAPISGAHNEKRRFG